MDWMIRLERKANASTIGGQARGSLDRPHREIVLNRARDPRRETCPDQEVEALKVAHPIGLVGQNIDGRGLADIALRQLLSQFDRLGQTR